MDALYTVVTDKQRRWLAEAEQEQMARSGGQAESNFGSNQDSGPDAKSLGKTALSFLLSLIKLSIGF